MSTTPSQYDRFVFARCLDDEAKWYWWASMWVGAGVFLIGILGIALPRISTVGGYLAAGLAFVSFLLNQAFESSRSRAQELRRKLDLEDGFGWAMTIEEFNDLLIRCSKSVKKRASGMPADAPYCASEEPRGPVRALQNVRESAWWSEHLAEKMHKLMLKINTILIVVSILSLVVALATVELTAAKNLDIYSKIARSVTAVLMLLLSLNLIKLTVSYERFSRGAARCKDAADAQLKRSPKNSDQAIMKMYDYFIVRSGSPPIPSWLWNWHREELNELYPYKAQSPL